MPTYRANYKHREMFAVTNLIAKVFPIISARGIMKLKIIPSWNLEKPDHLN